MPKLLAFLLLYATVSYADTIERYMNISNNIPTMEMKADLPSQTWARSARNILVITNESIAETLLELNRQSAAHGQPLFCMPPQIQLTADNLKNLIEDAYRNIPSVQSDKNKMTVSQVAWLAVNQRYPCNKPSSTKRTQLIRIMHHEQG